MPKEQLDQDDSQGAKRLEEISSQYFLIEISNRH